LWPGKSGKYTIHFLNILKHLFFSNTYNELNLVGFEPGIFCSR
jgi:hypothetical protein